jgi:hypothetical protein
LLTSGSLQIKKISAGEERIRKANQQFMDTLDQLEISLVRCREVMERDARIAHSATTDNGGGSIKEEPYMLDTAELTGFEQGEAPMTIMDLEGRKLGATPAASDQALGMTPAAQGETPAALSLDTRVPAASTTEDGGLSALSAGNALTFLQDLDTADTGTQEQTETMISTLDMGSELDLDGFDVDTSMFQFFEDQTFDFGLED